MMKLDDIYIRETLDQVALEESIYRSVMWQSGAVETDAKLVELVGANDGRLFQSRYWKDIDQPDDDPNPATGAGPIYPDDSDNLIPTFGIKNGLFQAHKNGPTMAWGEKDIVRRLGFLDDPLGVISDRVAVYWGKYFDMYAVNQVNGVLADNIANDGGDMVNDISDDTVAPDAVNSISPEAIIDTMFTAGDTADDFAVMIVHSKVMAQLRKQNLIDTIPSSDGKTMFQFYQNLRVLVSDNVPVDTSGAFDVATTYIVGPGVIGYGQNLSGIVPSELWRDPRIALGAGETQLITRQQFSMHVWGTSYLDAVCSGSTAQTSGDNIYPNLADQANALNWDRIVTDRKQIRIAALYSNV